MATVLIAGSEHLGALKKRAEFRDALTFADTDALRALEAITRQRPAVVALERDFAATSRGSALINRVKADPSLSRCDVRIIEHDGAEVTAPEPPAAPANAAAAAAQPEPAPAAPLDQRGTRRAPRFKMTDGVEVLVDGNPAMVVDLSVVGAQVISPTILKPNQRVRVALAHASRTLRFAAAIAWAAFEMPKTGTHYRAGMEFFDADAKSLERFIESKKK